MVLAAAKMKPGLYDRLRRLGAEARNTWTAHLDDDTIRAALDQHGSVDAAAPASIPFDITTVYTAEGSIDRVTAHYQTTRFPWWSRPSPSPEPSPAA